MNTKHTNIIKSILRLFICVLVGFLLGGGVVYHLTKKSPQIERIIVNDTIKQTQIVEKTKLKYVTKFDTIIQTQIDSVIYYDTLYLPIEHKCYYDSFITDTTKLNLKIDYSGFKPSIDTVIYKLSYNPNNALKSKKNGKWGQSIHLGVYAGYGLDIQTQPKFSPSVGVCISYGFGYSW